MQLCLLNGLHNEPEIVDHVICIFIMVVKANISRVYLKIIIHILIYYRFGGSALCNVLLRQNCEFDSHSIAHLIFDLIWPLYLQNSYVFINYFEHLFSIIG